MNCSSHQASKEKATSLLLFSKMLHFKRTKEIHADFRERGCNTAIRYILVDFPSRVLLVSLFAFCSKNTAEESFALWHDSVRSNTVFSTHFGLGPLLHVSISRDSSWWCDGSTHNPVIVPHGDYCKTEYRLSQFDHLHEWFHVHQERWVGFGAVQDLSNFIINKGGWRLDTPRIHWNTVLLSLQ